MVADGGGKVPGRNQHVSIGVAGMQAGINFAPRPQDFDRKSPKLYSS
jgi:hypothetical protein